MTCQTKESQAKFTPASALSELLEGNKRFVSGGTSNYDYQKQVTETSCGQYPFATVISCIDSRIPTETIFDLGIGDIFNARVAGSVINEDVLGSLEFACKLAGTHLILVLGHTACGAVKGACDKAELGNLTSLLKKISPAIDATKTKDGEARDSSNADFVNRVAEENVRVSINAILKDSPVLKEMQDAGVLDIKGAMYDISNGKVSLID